MQRNMDKIQFESRMEINELSRILSEYMKQNPKERNNDILKRFYDLLDVMDMEW